MKKALRKTIRLMGNSLRKSVPRVLRVQGSTLLYIVLVMVIFGMLGATVVSLFTTSTVSSATVNEDRRARYLYESAVRYATSEMRNNDFDQDMIDDLDATTYTLDDVGTFDYDIYSIWFRSNVDVNIPSGGPFAAVEMEEGDLPAGFSIPYGNIFLVNIESADIDPITGKVHIPAASPAESASDITLIQQVSSQNYRIYTNFATPFAVSQNERVCLAVRPTSDQNPSEGEVLNVHEDARFILPKFNGVVFIKTEPVYYEEAIHEPGLPLKLTGLSEGVDVTSSDYVILWPANHTVIPTADTANVTYGGSANHAVNVVDTGDLTLGKYGRAKPDIDDKEFVENLNENEAGDTDLFTRDLVDKKLSIGDSAGLSDDSFGGVWYDTDKSVGGVTDYCSTNFPDGCEFGIGIRVFFTFTYSGEGDGFIFSVVNATNNDATSIGGDIQASELLGYAGDSRITANPGAPPSANYLDATGEGLQPPKIGLEIDTRTNFNTAIESSLAYCSDATNLNVNTRNDPLSSGKDAVQYVFWGRDSFIDIPCRDPSPGRDTYDDNRHNALGFASGTWSENLFGNVDSSPIVGPDGTVYVGSDNNSIFAINPDGTQKWAKPVDSELRTAPALSPSGATVYATSVNGTLYAFNATNGTPLWNLSLAAASPSKPVIDGSGIIYVTAGINLIKIDPAGPTILLLFSAPLNPTARSAPVLNGDGSRVLVIFNNNVLYALNSANFSEIWNRPASGSVGSPAVHPSTGDIYVSVNTGMNQWASDGTFQGSYGFGSSVSSGPSISLDGNTVYVGYVNGVLAARNAAGLGPRWTYSTGSSQAITSPPMIDASEHIYFGADNNSVYALFSDGSLKWSFTTGGDVRTTPAIDANGIVYAGSRDNQLWAIEALAEPKNYRQNLDGAPASSELARNLVAYNSAEALNPYPAGFVPTDSDDWLKTGPWAVRMEITRNPSSGDYLLRTWVRQCTGAGNSCDDILGTFFEDTRVTYEPSGAGPTLEQSFNLGGTLNTDFNRFLFGFTSAGAAGDTQDITIEKFQLSFIRPNDPVITNDPQFP